MTKDRLRKTMVKACKYYIIVVSVLFLVFELLVWPLFVGEENLEEYCIYADPAGYYDFLINEHSACLIDWMYFIREPLALSALVYAVLVGPVALAGFFLKRAEK